MAAYGKVTMYVISENGLEQYPFLFQKATRSLVVSNNSKSVVSKKTQKTQLKLHNKIQKYIATKYNAPCHHEVAQSKCSKNVGTVNLTEAIPERNVIIHDSNTKRKSGSLSRQLQNGEIMFCSPHQEDDDLEKPCRVHQVVLKAEEVLKEHKARTKKYFAVKVTVPKQYRRKIFISRYLIRGKGKAENFSNKDLSLFQGGEIKEYVVTDKIKGCLPPKFAHLIKTKPVNRTEDLNEQLMAVSGKTMPAAERKTSFFKETKNDFHTTKPDLSTKDKNRKNAEVATDKNEKSKKTCQKIPEKPTSSHSPSEYLPRSRVKYRRHLSTPLITLKDGYLSKYIDHKRSNLPCIDSSVFVDLHTGKSHTLPGAVTLQNEDYNRWSRPTSGLPRRQNRARSC